jgi:hypothetical protein
MSRTVVLGPAAGDQDYAGLIRGFSLTTSTTKWFYVERRHGEYELSMPPTVQGSTAQRGQYPCGVAAPS